MSRRGKRRRPPRAHWWQGVVGDVDVGMFGVRLVPVCCDGPELWADFSVARFPDAAPGVVFNLYVYRRGRKARTVFRARDTGRWTQGELDAARARARAWTAEIAAAGLDEPERSPAQGA